MPRFPRIRRARAIGVLLLTLLWSAGTHAAPDAEPWPRWEAHDPRSTRVVDHSAWDALLKRYVVPSEDGIHRVRYRDLARDGRPALDAYLSTLNGIAVSSLTRDEQRAYWINLYNALTLRVVLDHYPVASIRDIDTSPGWFSDGPWQQPLATVEGESLTLDDIEHRILRPIWRDPRIHYAVNCASLGCPNLQRDAFTGAGTEALLETAARAYINHPRGLDWRDGEWVASKIYKWFDSDFGASAEARADHWRRYADPARAAKLRESVEVGAYRYDWALNDAAPRPTGGR